MSTLAASAEPRLKRPRRHGGVRLLDVDPELGNGLRPEQWRVAADAATAAVVRHEPGDWRLISEPDHAWLGGLILRGIILVRLEVGRRGHLEVLGEGDVISPCTGVWPDPALPVLTTARVISELRLAWLDRGFALRTAPWPELHAALIQRLVMRSRRLSFQSAVNSLPRIEERVELTMWQLAYRFGRATPAGLKLQLRLTHSQLAEMVAAQRPSVSVALAALTSEGRLLRPGKDEWVLCGPPPNRLSPLAGNGGLR